MNFRLSFPRLHSEPLRFAAVWIVICLIVIVAAVGFTNR